MTLRRLADENPTLKGHKLVLLSPWPTPQATIDGLRARFADLQIVVRQQPWENGDPDALLKREEWRDVTVLLTGSALPAKEDAPRVQYVQLLSAGVNHLVEKPLFKDTQIPFCTANGVHGPQITEWVISTYLAFQHKIPQYLQLQHDCKWKRLDYTTEDAVEKTVGILGYGSIGRQVARVCTALGMRAHAYTLHAKDTPESRRDRSYTPPGTGDPQGLLPSRWFSGGSTADRHAFLSSGLDLLVIALPLTDDTQHSIGKAEFDVLAAQGEGRTFVSNIARGPIVVTDDLIQALDSGKIKGAALDVADPEPLPEWHPLWKAKNTIITPHVSGASTRYYERVLRILELNLSLLAQGKELTNKVNRRDGY